MADLVIDDTSKLFADDVTEQGKPLLGRPVVNTLVIPRPQEDEENERTDPNENMQDSNETIWGALKDFIKPRLHCTIFFVLTLIVLAVFIIGAVCLLFYAVIYLPISTHVLTEHNSNVSVKYLTTDIGKYGLEMISGLSSWIQESVEVTVDTKVQNDIKIVMPSGEVLTNTVRTSLNQNQSSISPGINTVYANSNLTYEVTVTGEIGTKFGVNFTRTDKYGHKTTTPKEYSLRDSNSVSVHFTSNDSGYYDIMYDISTPGASIHVQGYLSYTSINASYYTENANLPSCIISATKNKCEIPVPFQLLQVTSYSVIAVVDSSDPEGHVLSLTTKQLHRKYMTYILSTGTGIGVIICVILYIAMMCYCCHRNIKQSCFNCCYDLK